ncbi:MAG: multicopper oxidase domain-containing protein [Hyphomicrobiales bacterium]|nr:multicopper oxidase domain-containing protein [Hyphomicrobiales bacterium]
MARTPPASTHSFRVPCGGPGESRLSVASRALAVSTLTVGPPRRCITKRNTNRASSSCTLIVLSPCSRPFYRRAIPGVRPIVRENVTLVAPPHVHAHEQMATRPPVIKEFTLTVQEKKIVVDEDRTTMNAMTYDGSIPGPMMVVHEGDYIELTLVNPETNEMAHNIDFHAATGELGGAALTLVSPGEHERLHPRSARRRLRRRHPAQQPRLPFGAREQARVVAVLRTPSSTRIRLVKAAGRLLIQRRSANCPWPPRRSILRSDQYQLH